MVVYTILSGAIYFGAVMLFTAIVIGPKFNSSEPDPPLGAFLTGLSGALVLALATKLVARVRLSPVDEIRTTLLGAGAGVLFIPLLDAADYLGPFSLVLAFIVWQTAVGWSLTRSIQLQTEHPPSSPVS